MGKMLKNLFSTNKGKLLAVSGALALFLIVLAAGFFLLPEILFGSINKIDPDQTYASVDPDAVFEESEPIETSPVVDQAETISKGNNIINVLLVGQDRRANEGEGPQRTDAMILCTINKSEKTITMTSFMRDLWVYIPDLYNQRLNIPYKLGGFKLLNETLDYNFGVSSDYNVEVDFAGFMETIDVIGGVEIELTAAEAKYLNSRGNWGVEENKNWKLKEGVNLLTGSQALAYSRIRQIGTDFGRTNRQRTVLTAIIEKTKELSPTQLFDLARKIMPLVSTDMTNSEIMDLIVDVLPILSDLKIVSQRIPVDGEYGYAKKGEADVIVLTKEQLKVNKELLEDTLGS